jgi:hypothetical protein
MITVLGFVMQGNILVLYILGQHLSGRTRLCWPWDRSGGSLPQLWLCALFPLFGNTFSFSRLQWLLLVLPFFHPLMMRATGRGWLCLACFFPLLCHCHPPRGLPVSLIHLLLSVLLYPGGTPLIVLALYFGKSGQVLFGISRDDKVLYQGLLARHQVLWNGEARNV